MPSLGALNLAVIFDQVAGRWPRLTARDLRTLRRRPDEIFEIMWVRYGYLNERVARELSEMAQDAQGSDAIAS